METGTVTTKDWRNLGSLDGLKEKGRIVLKLDERQIAIFKTEEGLFAINNRCPHEGYPLVEGTLNDSCTLACNWHGWAFDLKSGKALQGRDAVKTYPVEERQGEIWIDLTPEAPAVIREKAYSEFEEAMSEHDYERMARSICRIEKSDVAFEDVARKTIAWSLPRFERGFGHAHAGLADWISLAGSDPELRLVAFLEALGHFSWDGLFSAPLNVSDKVQDWDETRFDQALEAMDGPVVMSIIRGAFSNGLHFSDLKPSFLNFIFRHYAGFGHPAIYVVKLEQLIAQLGNEVEEALTIQLGQYLCLAAREDLIPEFKGFAENLTVAPGRAQAPKAIEFVGKSVRAAYSLVAGSLHHKEDLFESLLEAAALNMLLYDIELQNKIEQPIAQNVGWLDFTHAITFAEAVHIHVSDNPEYWQSGLMQMACFTGRNARYVKEQDWSLWRVANKEQFLAEQKAALFNMDVGEYIYAVHRLKMVTALEGLSARVGDETNELLFAAVNRYLHSPLRQRHPARDAFQARETVSREG